MANSKGKKPFWKRWWFWVIIVVIIGGIGAAGESEDIGGANNQSSSNNVVTENNATQDKNKQEDSDKKNNKDTKIKAGTYKVGNEIPAGEYLVISKNEGYVEVASDSTGELESIISNDNIKGNTYITVKDGNYLKIRNADAYPVAEAPGIVPKDGIYKDGKYKVGQDIPAGEYKVILTSKMGYVEVSSDSTGELESIVANENVTSDTYITVKDGQYLKLHGVEINTN